MCDNEMRAVLNTSRHVTWARVASVDNWLKDGRTESYRIFNLQVNSTILLLK